MEALISDFIFRDIDVNKLKDIELLKSFYFSIYLKSFPNKNECESFENFLYFLENSKVSSSYKYHIILILKDDVLLGGAVFNYLLDIESGYIEFLTINEKYQSKGIGSLLYEKVLKVLNQDARDMCSGLKYIFGEIDNPKFSIRKLNKYLYFWDKQGFRRLNIDYIQPALSKNQNDVNCLWFVIKKMTNEIESSIKGKFLVSVLDNIFKNCFKNVYISNEIENMYKEILQKDEIELKGLM